MQMNIYIVRQILNNGKHVLLYPRILVLENLYIEHRNRIDNSLRRDFCRRYIVEAGLMKFEGDER